MLRGMYRMLGVRSSAWKVQKVVLKWERSRGLFAVLWFRYDTLLYNDVTVKISVRIQRDYQRTREFIPFSGNSYDGT